MSHTEQMREALEAIELALRMNIPAAEILKENSPIRDGIRAALTAPAAEVPEAMGDAEILAAWYACGVGEEWDCPPCGDTMKAIRSIIAARDAQWQSTRLRGGVPEGWQVHSYTTPVGAKAWLLKNCEGEIRIDAVNSKHVQVSMWDARKHCIQSEMLISECAKRIIDASLLTAAPKAPAPALDAGVVRDARAAFEAMNRDSHGFKRSPRGTYRNPPVARDWKWFQAGIDFAKKGGQR